jgi:hypothetical protein
MIGNFDRDESGNTDDNCKINIHLEGSQLPYYWSWYRIVFGGWHPEPERPSEKTISRF